MSLNTLETAHANGDLIDASHVNEITLALLGAFVGRNASGIPTAGQDLGTALYPWGAVYSDKLIIDDVVLDTSVLASKANRLISGRVRSSSSAKSDFIRANGTTLSFQILGATTPLQYVVNNKLCTLSADLTVAGLTAAPSTNNTLSMNETSLPPASLGLETGAIYLGEDGDYMSVDGMGSNITAKIGQVVALKNTELSVTEIMYCYVESATRLTNIYRGFFFDSSGNPITRSGKMGDNSTWTLLNLGWIFLEDNASTVDVSYRTPVYAYDAPVSADSVTGDYWYDQGNNVWKRYSGSAWIQINRTLIGVCVNDTTKCLASRSFDFDKTYSALNTCEVVASSVALKVTLGSNVNKISINGSTFEFASNLPLWDISKDIVENPTPTLAGSAIGSYYVYITEKGQRKLTGVKPYDRTHDLLGYYHPYEMWRCIGFIYVGADPAGTAIGVLETCRSFPYNRNIRSISQELYFSKAAGTDAGGASLGSNTIVYNEVFGDGVFDSVLLAGGPTQLLTLGFGVYDIEGYSVAHQVGKHRNYISVTNRSTTFDEVIGAMTTSHPLNGVQLGQQTVSTFKKRISIRNDFATLSSINQCEAAKATDGLGKAFNVLGRELYAVLKITRVK